MMTKIYYIICIGLSCTYSLLSSAHINKIQIATRNPAGIVGESDFILAGDKGKNLPEEVRAYAWAQGALEVIKDGDSIPICSVAHIGNGYAITAGHCVISSTSEEKEISHLTNNFFLIDWDTGAISGKRWVSVKEIVWARHDDDVDFALLKVTKNYPSEKLEMDFENHVYYGSMLTLFGHPDKRPLTWSNFCSSTNAQERYAIYYNDNYLPHTCDSEPGSSGGSLIRMDTGKVVGVISGEVVNLVKPEDKGIFTKVTPDKKPAGNFAFRLEMLPIEIKDLLREISNMPDQKNEK